MSKPMQRLLPVFASIVVIVVVAVLRARSKALAAITATMPLNVPLALWIIYVADDTDQSTVVNFTRTMLVGLGASGAWLVAGHFAARAGWGLVRIFLVGYAAWGLTILVLIFAERLLDRSTFFLR